MIIILHCIVRILLEIYQLIHHRRDYFMNFINYLEGFLYVATIVFVSNFQLHCLPSWQWQLGAMCIFLSWINFILFLSEQPGLGIYVVMFQDILKTFIYIVPMAVLLVLAFGQPFYMLLSVVETDVSKITACTGYLIEKNVLYNDAGTSTAVHYFPIFALEDYINDNW